MSEIVGPTPTPQTRKSNEHWKMGLSKLESKSKNRPETGFHKHLPGKNTFEVYRNKIYWHGSVYISRVTRKVTNSPQGMMFQANFFQKKRGRRTHTQGMRWALDTGKYFMEIFPYIGEASLGVLPSTLLEPQSRFGDKTTQASSSLSPKRDCGSKGVNGVRSGFRLSRKSPWKFPRGCVYCGNARCVKTTPLL